MTHTVKTYVAPTAREARQQIQQLLQPNRSVAASRALAYLGHGASSGAAVELLVH